MTASGPTTRPGRPSLSDAEADDSATPRRVDWLRTLAVVAAPAVVFVMYSFFFQLTKPSAVSSAATSELVTVLGFASVTAVALGLAGAAVAMLADLAGARVAPRARGGPGTIAVTAGLYAVVILTFVENLVYSATGWGLKVSEDLAPKLTFGLLAAAVGLLLALRTVSMSSRAMRRIVTGLVVLLVLGAPVVVHTWVTAPEAPRLLRAEGSPSRSYNVVVLSADGIDADEMSVYGYERKTTPFLDSVASEFRVYDNAFTNNGNTTGSITSLLNGRSPFTTDVVYPPDALEAEDAQRTLPYLLGREGYYRSNWAVPHYADATDQNLVGAFDTDNGDELAGSMLESLPLGTGPQRWFVVETLTSAVDLVADVVGIEELDNPFGQIEVIIGNTLSDADRLAAVETEVRAMAPFFVNTHFMATHGPAFDLKTRLFSRGQEQTEPWERDFYDDSIRAFDDDIRRVYEALEDKGRLEDTMVVVTSDHGRQYDARERIPLLIRYPNTTLTGRSAVNVQRMDVAPTVLELLGFEQPAWMPGSALLNESAIPEDRLILSATTAKRHFSHRFGFRTGHNDLVVTAVRCGHWVQQQPDGTQRFGSVQGSSSTCEERPSIPTRLRAG